MRPSFVLCLVLSVSFASAFTPRARAEAGRKAVREFARWAVEDR